MSDLSTAFQLLDIIQGHPGYEVKCYQCGEPITDILGVTLPDAGNLVGGFDGTRHADSVWGDCPVIVAKYYEDLQARMSLAKASPPGPFFPAESPE